jgi:hypothetical protein
MASAPETPAVLSWVRPPVARPSNPPHNTINRFNIAYLLWCEPSMTPAMNLTEQRFDDTL